MQTLQFTQRKGIKPRHAADTALRVRVEQFDRALDLVTWQILDSDNQRMVQKCFGCGGEEDVTLDKAGEYLLHLGTRDRERGIGAYEISLSQVR